MKNPLLRQLLKLVFSLAAIVIVFGFLSHIMLDSESLADYSARKAQAAYDVGDTHINEEKAPDSAQEKKESEEKSDMTLPDTDSHNTDTADSTVQSTGTQDAAKGASDQISTSGISTDEAPEAARNQNPEIPDSRIVYKEGFYYEQLSDALKERITGISYPVSASDAASLAVPAINTLSDDTIPAVSYDDLRYLHVQYYDFNGTVQDGELICNKGIAQDLAEIFYDLYLNEYQIERIRLIDEYQGDDTASMADNNTSCFNYRVVDGTSSLSKHALGCAVDINPFYNPYVVFNRNGSGETYISPAGSEVYADRAKDFPYKIDENDLCYRLFKEHGFIWGGNWNSCKDYQHFQKTIE